jgi:hypothetical protein
MQIITGETIILLSRLNPKLAEEIIKKGEENNNIRWITDKNNNPVAGYIRIDKEEDELNISIESISNVN